MTTKKSNMILIPRQKGFRIITDTKPPETLRSLTGEVDIVNAQLPNTENQDESEVEEPNSEDNESAFAVLYLPKMISESAQGHDKITWVFMNYYRWFVPQFSLAPDHAVHFWWDRWRAFFWLQRGYEFAIYESWRMRVAKRLREMMHEIRNKGASHGWIWDDL
ncbi:hypothetical protein PIB30_057396 [Stylosanthes scabra]|uniref:Uncharacterized protein n=1 Tax=Stylosanthes scabra TaxID=79078 RepID=A0ABU6VHV6_9FABA|nr:hypothetical protein [Stylosanthes scabra]